MRVKRQTWEKTQYTLFIGFQLTVHEWLIRAIEESCVPVLTIPMEPAMHRITQGPHLLEKILSSASFYPSPVENYLGEWNI